MTLPLSQAGRGGLAGLTAVLGNEGFRLFFPLAAFHAALWPILWIGVQGYGLAGASDMPPVLWHMHEMIWGSYGAALIGFLTTGFPEWTDTEPPRGRPLWLLAGAWGLARLIGLVGMDALTVPAALADLAWLLGLLIYGIRISVRKQTDELRAFLFWLALLTLAEGVIRFQMILGDPSAAVRAAQAGGLILLAFLGLALARITVQVTNRVLDPTELTSPFRPHPGRLNLAPGLVALAVAAEALGASPAVSGWLFLAAGAGFIDRVGEGFIGREAFRTEILSLSLPAGLAGAGLIWIGIARIGAPTGEAGGWHLALMGGLGLAVLASMSVAGLFHAGYALPFPRRIRFALLALIAAVLCRILPEVTDLDPLIMHLSASALWALTFGLWLSAYWPILSDPETIAGETIC